MLRSNQQKESKVEVAKRKGRHLRGTIAECLKTEATHFEHDDVQLLKFHGIYQQDDRDLRKERRQAGLEKEFSFMVRLALPGGMLNAQQYLALDRIADEYANGSLRITTRQGFQLYGVLKNNLKETIAGLNKELITTLSACGDVERNLMCCPAPLDDPAYVLIQELARTIAEQLRPASRAYHEIWLDGEKVVSTDAEEPFYGDRYLPRKFKTGITIAGDASIDIYSYDCGLIAIVEDGEVRGFNVLVGGGMGMTHGREDTFAALAERFGFVGPDDGVETVRTVAAIFRDHGNRGDRRHARLKYLLAEWGIERFREEFRQRVPFELGPWVEIPEPRFDDFLGKRRQSDGRFFYGIFVENGRVVDRPDKQIKSALRKIAEKHRCGIRLTPQQSLLLTDLSEQQIEDIEQTLKEHGVALVEELSAARRYSMACPALPTCGLALAESERLMPTIVDRFEAELESLGLGNEPLTLRMTGCPNGCARPYTADIAFVGRKPGLYHVYVGGGLRGDRIADLYAADVPEDRLHIELRPLLAKWANQRRTGESLSDFYQRLIKRESPRRVITGKEQPTSKLIQLGLPKSVEDSSCGTPTQEGLRRA